MTKEQIESLQLVGERVLIEQTIKPKHSLIVLPDGKPTPDMYTITNKVVKISPAVREEYIKEGLDKRIIGAKPYFVSHMQPEAILEESDIDPKEGGVAYIVVNYRHILGYDLSS